MLPAKDQLLLDIDAFSVAASSPALLVGSTSATDANEAARLTRNGLAVVGLAIFERYVRDRSSELLSALSGQLSLSMLPKPLQDAVTRDIWGLTAGLVKTMDRGGEDPLPLIHRTSQAIASTATSPANLAEISLLWMGSNMSKSHLADVLRRLGAKDGWQEMTALSLRAGFPASDMCVVMKSLLDDRHRAAHRADADISLIALRTVPRNTLALAMAFDSIASRAARLCREQNALYLRANSPLASAIPLAFLDDAGGGTFEEHLEGASKIYVHRDLISARTAAIKRAARPRAVVVQRDRNHIPCWWHSTDN
jgi:hypothetical protein